MATQAHAAHPFAGPKVHYRPSKMDPKQRFYRHFLDSETSLRDDIAQLHSFAAFGGERQDAIDHVLAGISKLQNEVADAGEFTPAYDRKQYSEAVKALQDKLNETVTSITPKSRFQFRRGTKTPHVDMGATENDPRYRPGSLSPNGHQHPLHGSELAPAAIDDAVEAEAVSDERDDAVPELPEPSSPVSTSRNYNEEMARPSGSSLRKPSFSTAKSIGISGQKALHIILPASAARAAAAGSLTDLKGCIVDMSVPADAPNGGAGNTAFPGLMIKNVAGSLLVAGRVSGAVHITGVTDSIIVVSARQVRIHECRDVDIYLHCGSHPIIEDCTGMRFAPLPECYTTDKDRNSDNQWDKVDDFKWLKAGHSPNWSTLPEGSGLGEDVWTKVVPGRPGASVSETLAKVGVPRK